MISIICDKCKKPVKNAVREKNYRILYNRNLCMNCYDEATQDIKETMLAKDSFDFTEYKSVLSNYLKKECS